MSQVLSVIKLLLMIFINLALDLVNLGLHITEGPLLRLLHLDHHLLDLFELLERISLH